MIFGKDSKKLATLSSITEKLVATHDEIVEVENRLKALNASDEETIVSIREAIAARNDELKVLVEQRAALKGVIGK